MPEFLDTVHELSESQWTKITFVFKELVSQACIEKFRFGELVEFEQLNQG